MASSDVRICNAVKPGVAVEIRDWYLNGSQPSDTLLASRGGSNGWKFVARAKSGSMRSIIAQGANDVFDRYSAGLIEYADDSRRSQLFDWVESGHTIGQLTSKKYCDCASMISAIVRLITDAAYVTDAGEQWNLDETGLLAMINSTGLFDVYTDSAHVSSCTKLCVGDIIWRPKWLWNTENERWTGGAAAIVVYSTYDEAAPEYVDIPESQRDIGWGRVTQPYEYVSNGPVRSRESAPWDPSQLSDFELFMLGAFITGGEAVAIEDSRTNKGFTFGDE